jgi:hypothetical protein
VRSRFLVSLDYELAWGTYEMTPVEYCRTNVINANEAAERIFELHERIEVPVAWAVVGAAVDPDPLRDRVERCRAAGAPMDLFDSYVASVPPELRDRVTSIPKRVVQRIAASDLQEIASHSYSHLYADRAGHEDYSRDFDLFSATLQQLRIPRPMLFVAPKNLVNDDIRRLAASHGFQAVRVNPCNWLYRFRPRRAFGTPLVRAVRFVDAFLPVNECFELFSRRLPADPGTLEGNFFFRPALRWRLLDRLHFWRFKVWVAFAVRTGRDVHLWSHPHNFGIDVARAIENYERALLHMRSVAAARRIPFLRASEAR